MLNNNQQIANNDQPPMTETTKKIYNLEERTYEFAKNVAFFCKDLPKIASNIEYGKQVIRSSGSVGANYIEANEALGKKDFKMRIRICLKEAKETAYWLRLIVDTNEVSFKQSGVSLFQEATELKKIYSSILLK